MAVDYPFLFVFNTVRSAVKPSHSNVTSRQVESQNVTENAYTCKLTKIFLITLVAGFFSRQMNDSLSERLISKQIMKYFLVLFVL